MRSLARTLIRWSLIVFVVAVVVGLLETLALGPKGPKQPGKSDILTAVED